MNKISAIYQGQLDSLENIKVSPFSRAYTFSDSVYEVIPYFDGVPLCFQRHLERLKLSLEMSGISVDMSIVQAEIKKLALELKSKNGYVYFQISRGVDELRSHLHQDDMIAERFGYVVSIDLFSRPISAMLCADNRWAHCNIKSTSLLGNVLLMNQARSQGCKEVVMHRNNYLTEAGASNVFYLNAEGIVRTSALNENILPGITREILINALVDSPFKVEEGKCNIGDFDSSSCIWLSSSTKGLLPLNKLIGSKYIYEESNESFEEINKIFNAAIQSHLLAAI
ncbi:aminotransferase class IV [Gammaproteobacteria bacterium]|nr:aminotransferase class IV [Gammaproteobacteria bacterium]MDB4183398.1 aminotransferase class IV [Gammaproteobacteria bacterium]